MSRFDIRRIVGREILDGGGNPTVEVDVLTEGGFLGRAAVPSGRSIGKHEALELRDGGNRYRGRGVLVAVRNVNQIIAPNLEGRDVTGQRQIDELLVSLDGTDNKSKLGANAILGVSLAVAKAAAQCLGTPIYKYVGGADCCILPVPMLAVLHGGKYAPNDLDFEDFIIIPFGAETFSEGLRMGAEVYHELIEILQRRYGKSINLDTPPLKNAREALDTMLNAIEELGYQDKFGLGLDAAASDFYDEKKEKYVLKEGGEVSKTDLIKSYNDLVLSYPILSLEDPLDEDDYEGFARITKELKIQVVGDDIFATNADRLRRGIEIGAANALLMKLNQVGTLTEALDASELAVRSEYAVQVSSRSGETEDPIIADIAVGIASGQIKTGAPVRSERNAKFNQLLRIQEELGRSAKYPGKEFRGPFRLPSCSGK